MIKPYLHCTYGDWLTQMIFLKLNISNNLRVHVGIQCCAVQFATFFKFKEYQPYNEIHI